MVKGAVVINERTLYQDAFHPKSMAISALCVDDGVFVYKEFIVAGPYVHQVAWCCDASRGFCGYKFV